MSVETQLGAVDILSAAQHGLDGLCDLLAAAQDASDIRPEKLFYLVDPIRDKLRLAYDLLYPIRD